MLVIRNAPRCATADARKSFASHVLLCEVRTKADMTQRPCLAFACAHLCDEHLYRAQLAALGDAYDCRVFVFREEDSMRAMAETLLAGTPQRFTLIGLSLGGYVA